GGATGSGDLLWKGLFVRTIDVFVEATKNCADLPDAARKLAADAVGVEESTYDKSYIEFLDLQIELNARGPEWTDLLRRRRATLAPFCDCRLISGRIPMEGGDVVVYVD